MRGFGLQIGITCAWVAAARIALAQPSTKQDDRQVLPNEDNVEVVPQSSSDCLSSADSLRCHPRTSALHDHLLLRGHASVAGPAGTLGVDLDIIPIDWFALEAGIGVSPNGLQWAVTSKLRYPTAVKGLFVGVGFGVSWGKYSAHGAGGLLAALDQGEQRYATLHWSMARWYNFEADLDRYAKSGRAVMHFALGIGRMQNSTEYTCATEVSFGSTYPCDPDPPWRPVTAYVVFGYGFSI